LVRTLLFTACIACLSIVVACAAPSTPVVLAPPQASESPTALSSPTALPDTPTALPSLTVALSSPTAAPSLPTQAPPTERATALPSPTTAPATAPPPPTAVPVAPPLTHYFGVSSNGEVAANDEVRALAILSGAQMVRTSIAWRQVEPTQGKYDWRYADSAFHALTDNNLEPLVLIMDNTEWGASTKCGPVSDLLAYDQFLRQLAARYPNVTYWALYNEPDNAYGEAASTGGCFGGDDVDGNGKPDYADYAAQLQVAWRALHAGNPDAKLVVGAIAFDNFDQATAPPGYPGGGNGGIFNAKFLDNLFAYMQANPPPPGERYFDLLGFNYYNIYGPYWEGRSEGKGVSAKANALTKLMQQYGLAAPLLVSETGDDSGTIGDDAQSAFLAKTFVRGMESNIAHMIWWTFQDFPDTAPPPSNTWKYGLIDQNAKPKPSYSAFQTVAKLLGDAQFVQPLNVRGGEGYLFNKDGAGVAVLWSSSAEPISVSFVGNVLNVTDMYGAVRAVSDGSPEDHNPDSGRIALQLNQNPTYVQTVQ